MKLKNHLSDFFKVNLFFSGERKNEPHLQVIDANGDPYPQLQQSAHFTNYNTIRFNNDMNLGVGWGH